MASTVNHRLAFVNLVEQLLETLHKVFPNCSETDELRVKFKYAIKGTREAEDEIIKEWVTSVGPYVDRCMAKDETALTDIKLEIFDDIEFLKKWENLDQDSRNVLWVYINNITTAAMGCMPEIESVNPSLPAGPILPPNLAGLPIPDEKSAHEMKNALDGVMGIMPSSIMTKIETLAQTMAQDAQNGNMDFSELMNPAALQARLQITPEEMEEFGQTLERPDAQSQVLSVVSSLPPDMMDAVQTQMQNGELPDAKE